MDAAGCLQMCPGQRAGCEVAAHTMRETFADMGTEGIFCWLMPLMPSNPLIIMLLF